MKIEIKNVKFSEFASHETNCFQASVYVDGKRIGTAFNDGQGGCTYFDTRYPWEILGAYAETLPEKVLSGITEDGKPFTYKQTADSIVDDLLNDWLIERDFKKIMTKRVLFTRDGKVYETNALKNLKVALQKPQLKDVLKADLILNLLPYDQALAIYKDGQQ